MDRPLKIIVAAIVIVIFLMILKFTVFNNINQSDALIPGVTDNAMMTRIASNSTLGRYILNDSFAHDIAGINIESRSELYGTNETTGKDLFDKCYDSLTFHGMTQTHAEKNVNGGKYTGVFVNDTSKIVFYIFTGNDVKSYTGFELIMTVYRGYV